MAHWKISVTRSVSVNRIRLEKSMFVEMITSSTSDPLRTNIMTSHPQIGELFRSKYGVDLYKAGVVNSSYLHSERIS